MANSKPKRVPKTVLKLPDLEQAKCAVINSLTSRSAKHSYDPLGCKQRFRNAVNDHIGLEPEVPS